VPYGCARAAVRPRAFSTSRAACVRTAAQSDAMMIMKSGARKMFAFAVRQQRSCRGRKEAGRVTPASRGYSIPAYAIPYTLNMLSPIPPARRICVEAASAQRARYACYLLPADSPCARATPARLPSRACDDDAPALSYAPPSAVHEVSRLTRACHAPPADMLACPML